MDCREARELLPAHVDRELGVREAIDIDRHLQGCPACRADYAEQQAVRAAVRNHGTYFTAPGHLEDRLRTALPASARGRVPPAKRSWSWLNAGAALAMVLALAWSVGLYLTLPTAGDRLADEVVAAHVRSLMSSHVVDVVSSSQHTVKPWFDGKLDFAPPVHDLSADGFPLVGGRLDYLDRRPVAALVYRYRLHTINLFVAPAKDGGNVAPQTLSRQGYRIVSWTHAGMAFWAVSDVESAQLNRFTDAFQERGAS